MTDVKQTYGWEGGYGPDAEGLMRAAALVQITPERRVLLSAEPGLADIVGTHEDMEKIAYALNADDAAQALADAVEARQAHQKNRTTPADIWLSQGHALTDAVNDALAAYRAIRGETA